MDKRQQKSRKAIFEAFSRLLERKHFNNITVQDIINEANVGRSTFYAHFETKDVLLREMCSEIFCHVFSTGLSEAGLPYSRETEQSLETKLTHLLGHLRENRGNIPGLITGDSRELFLRYFKEVLEDVFRNYPEYIPAGVPEDFALDHLAGGFAETVRWWIGNGMREAPEDIAGYYIRMLPAPYNR